MGCGTWTSAAFSTYSTATNKRLTKDDFTGAYSVVVDTDARQTFKQRCLHEDLNLRAKIRKCCDCSEHTATVPVILGVDVTGSMGSAANQCVSKLNVIMTDLVRDIPDVEFAIVGIGDTDYDDAPLQFSQFESDVRIAQHLDKIYFEGGGGCNSWESYTLAWYAGLHHCDLDCWKRGKKGVIITMGDEPINPYLDADYVNTLLDDSVQGKSVLTQDLYAQASEKYDIYHIEVTHNAFSERSAENVVSEWTKYLPASHVFTSTVEALPQIISQIVRQSAVPEPVEATCMVVPEFAMGAEISW